MRRTVSIFVLVVAAAGLAAGFTFYVVETNCSTAMQIFRQAELARASERAASAYFKEPPTTSRWALENFFDALKTADASLLSEPDTLELYKFITAARLAKICQETGDSKSYEQYLRDAFECGKRYESSLSNSAALFKALDKIDERARNASNHSDISERAKPD